MDEDVNHEHEQDRIHAVRQTIAEDLDPSRPSPPGQRSASRAGTPTFVVGATALASAVAGSMYILTPAATETTDDAYISADATSVAPKVRGLVAQVLVRDNQAVQAGDPLVRIDAEEFDARVATAIAEQADAVAVCFCKRRPGQPRRRGAAGGLECPCRGELDPRAEAQAERAVADRERYEDLVARGFVAASAVDAYRAAAITAEQDVARSVALSDVSRHAEQVTRAKRATLEARCGKPTRPSRALARRSTLRNRISDTR